MSLKHLNLLLFFMLPTLGAGCGYMLYMPGDEYKPLLVSVPVVKKEAIKAVKVEESLPQAIKAPEEPKKKLYTVIASREGLTGKQTASLMFIKKESLFVALPSREALYHYVKVEYKGKSVVCQVLDVGPWLTKDAYWTKSGVPLTQKNGIGNSAGIDLSDEVFRRLGVPRKVGLVWVTWSFVD